MKKSEVLLTNSNTNISVVIYIDSYPTDTQKRDRNMRKETYIERQQIASMSTRLQFEIYTP